MNVVADTNVVISAIFWPGESRQCFLLWAKRQFHLALTVPLFEEQRSRDADDDPVLACAVASAASAIISRDADLLVLQKPFGIEILTPRQFLAKVG
jgi:predicted nucleic acid-binding protein